MSWVRTPFIRFSGTVLAGALVVLALQWGVRASGYQLTGLGFLALILGWSAVIGVILMRYWRGIDEAAREAQKWAWYWGGSIGMGVAAVGLAMNPFDVVGLLVPAGADRRSLLLHGAGVVMFGQLIGFHLAWAYWWWSRR
ncbi:MAG: hypothetical protein JNL41_10925 [Phenylobacterium sp.]|uniref:hypothetical protein n=1 Tax=Phenylobacterium sp. TaxID=1871053 RepID=UPI001A3AD499|nr:hypothetical protein [Phenylobacterium sp.]MBL8554782.1 hypothetical protein [Phenylobacterium sp.]